MAMDTVLEDAYDDAPAETRGTRAAAGNGNGKSWNKEERIRVSEPPKFDLESYISNYTGRTRFDRLFLIGTCSVPLSTEALKAAVTEAKAGKDVERYERAVNALMETAPNEPEAVLDTEWVEKTQKAVKAEIDRLEHELKGYKHNLIKESIRMGNEDMGNHCHEIGDLSAAAKAYSRMRDYCTTHNHIASMLFKVIHVSADRGDWLGLQSNVHRVRNLPSKTEEQERHQPKLSAAMGLSQLATGAYLEAAFNFIGTDPSLGDSYNEIISSNDVAVYGGLCALASMDRVDLEQRVLDNHEFRNFLELEPHIRRAISFFCASKFRPCLEILDSYRADYLLDIHLQQHVSTIYSRIRTKAIKQYLVPFSRVTLDAMAKVFPPADGATTSEGKTEPSLVPELIKLIQDGTLDSRIDLEKGVIVSKQADLRADVHKDAIDSIKGYAHEAHLRLARTNILHANLEVTPNYLGSVRVGLDEDSRGDLHSAGGRRQGKGIGAGR